ncbi:hypothetical protein EYZ11_006051 [Aspergillus tanneri]|uniref:Uncharacterized protein n=1 Tax=Aspergillus tanneri TaxID=1220188 RepID=A0A4S3JGG6_9EURO|nr:hypothetical protein EYZ11_006051 [Aspergillus tanneri]
MPDVMPAEQGSTHPPTVAFVVEVASAVPDVVGWPSRAVLNESGERLHSGLEP